MNIPSSTTPLAEAIATLAAIRQDRAQASPFSVEHNFLPENMERMIERIHKIIAQSELSLESIGTTSAELERHISQCRIDYATACVGALAVHIRFAARSPHSLEALRVTLAKGGNTLHDLKNVRPQDSLLAHFLLHEWRTTT